MRFWMMAGMTAIAASATGKSPPKLSDAAAALAQKGAFFLAPDDNLALPLAAGAKGVPFLATAAKRIELIAPSAKEGALLAIDGDAFRLRGAALEPAAAAVGLAPAASSDGKTFVGLDETKKALQITSGEKKRVVRYRRQGRWELEQPWVSPDGSWALIALRDYSQAFDAYSFLYYELQRESPEEIALSKSFIPGALRQPLADRQVGIQVFTQAVSEDGFSSVLRDAGVVVFDARTQKLGAAPEKLRPGLASPSGRHSLLPGAVVYDEQKRCGGDATQLFTEGEKPLAFRPGDGIVVSGLDFIGDDFVIANWLDVKKCRNKGVLIPLAGDAPPAKWPAFGLPVREGRIAGRVVAPGK